MSGLLSRGSALATRSSRSVVVAHRFKQHVHGSICFRTAPLTVSSLSGCTEQQQPWAYSSVMAYTAMMGGLQPARFFSTAPKKSKKNKTQTANTGMSYLEEKKAAKNRRRELYESRQARKERLKTRRSSDQPRDELRRAFRSFFIKRKVDEEYMNRKARQAGLDWKIHVAVILERLNVVLPDKEPWEIEYENLRAHLDRFGKMYPKELYNVDYEADVAITDEELMALLPKGFTPAPRETEADAAGDVRTIDRKLKTKVFLAVKDSSITAGEGSSSSRDEERWQMPTVALEQDETLLEAAKRALADKIGPEVEYWCPSNCPCSVDMVALPSEEREKSGFYGTKTFFMRLQHDEGDVSDSSMKVKDFAWLDSEEMVERVRNEQGDYMGKFYRYML